MIFTNPAGAPELACDDCGCRWFDRIAEVCYGCGAPIADGSREAYRQALEAFSRKRREANENSDQMK